LPYIWQERRRDGRWMLILCFPQSFSQNCFHGESTMFLWSQTSWSLISWKFAHWRALAEDYPYWWLLMSFSIKEPMERPLILILSHGLILAISVNLQASLLKPPCCCSTRISTTPAWGLHSKSTLHWFFTVYSFTSNIDSKLSGPQSFVSWITSVFFHCLNCRLRLCWAVEAPGLWMRPFRKKGRWTIVAVDTNGAMRGQ